MFIYGMRDPDEALVMFDRDFPKLRPLVGIEVLLNQWWEIEQADALDQSPTPDSERPPTARG